MRNLLYLWAVSLPIQLINAYTGFVLWNWFPYFEKIYGVFPPRALWAILYRQQALTNQ